MKRQHLDFTLWKKQALKDSKLRIAYNKLQPEFAVISALIEARIKNGMTQGELAEKIGTKQSVISRLESGHANPSIAFLKKLAEALNSHLKITFVS